MSQRVPSPRQGPRVPRQDVSTNQVNPRDPGNGQSARVGVHQGPVRLKPTTVYDGMGRPLGVTSGHLGGINAVGTDELRLKGAGKPVTCVYAWDVSTNQGPKSGWVPLSAVTHEPALDNEERAIGTRIARAQGSDRGHHTTFTVEPRTAKQAGAAGLYVFPDQHDPVANKAEYFFGKGAVGLFLNVPKKGDSGRFGIGSDVVPAGATFHADEDVTPIKVGLYHRESSKAVGHLRFVYGYFVNDAGLKRHGWINAAALRGT